MAEESSFLDFVLNESSSRRGGGNVGIAQRFPRWVRNPQGFACTVISTALSTARLGASFFPKASTPQLLEEFAFGLLHTLGSFGIADRSSDALKDCDAESLA